MKRKFSTKWRASKQPRKQRKYRANSPLHIKHKIMAGNLSKELRKKYFRRSFPIRKGDSVKVMTGKFKGKSGKVNSISLRKMKISIEGLQLQKKDGTKVNVYFNPSNCQIQELILNDKNREKALKRKIESKEMVKTKENHGGKDALKKK